VDFSNILGKEVIKMTQEVLQVVNMPKGTPSVGKAKTQAAREETSFEQVLADSGSPFSELTALRDRDSAVDKPGPELEQPVEDQDDAEVCTAEIIDFSQIGLINSQHEDAVVQALSTLSLDGDIGQILKTLMEEHGMPRQIADGIVNLLKQMEIEGKDNSIHRILGKFVAAAAVGSKDAWKGSAVTSKEGWVTAGEQTERPMGQRVSGEPGFVSAAETVQNQSKARAAERTLSISRDTPEVELRVHTRASGSYDKSGADSSQNHAKNPNSPAGDELKIPVHRSGDRLSQGNGEFRDMMEADSSVEFSNNATPTGRGKPVSSVNDLLSRFSQAVKENLEAKTHFFAREGRSEVRLQLKPEHLGQLRLQLVLENGSLNARFIVENHHARQMIENNLNQLKQVLEEQGISCQHAQVDVGGSGGRDSLDQGYAAFNHAPLLGPDPRPPTETEPMQISGYENRLSGSISYLA